MGLAVIRLTTLLCLASILFNVVRGEVCPFLRPSEETDMHQCGDDSSCNATLDATCCAANGSVIDKCAPEMPFMCADRDCGGDYCCVKGRDDCSTYGGLRICNKMGVCSWAYASNHDGYMLCDTGVECSVSSFLGTECCRSVGGPARCPKDQPNMCAGSCATRSVCCVQQADQCEPFGGLKPCVTGTISLSLTAKKSPSETLSSTFTPSLSDTLSLPTPSATFSVSSTFTPSLSDTLSLPTPSATFSVSSTFTSSLTESISLPTPTATFSISITSSLTLPTATQTFTTTLSSTASNSISVSQSTTSTLSPTLSRSLTLTLSKSSTPTFTSTSSLTKTPTASETLTPSVIFTLSLSTTDTPTLIVSPTTTSTKTTTRTTTTTISDTVTLPRSRTHLASATESSSADTRSLSVSVTDTPTASASQTPFQTLTDTATLSTTDTQAVSATVSRVHSATVSATVTATVVSMSKSLTRAVSRSNTATASSAQTMSKSLTTVFSGSQTATVSSSQTISKSPTRAVSSSKTSTISISPSISKSLSVSKTATVSSTQTMRKSLTTVFSRSTTATVSSSRINPTPSISSTSSMSITLPFAETETVSLSTPVTPTPSLLAPATPLSTLSHTLTVSLSIPEPSLTQRSTATASPTTLTESSIDGSFLRGSITLTGVGTADIFIEKYEHDFWQGGTLSVPNDIINGSVRLWNAEKTFLSDCPLEGSAYVCELDDDEFDSTGGLSSSRSMEFTAVKGKMALVPEAVLASSPPYSWVPLERVSVFDPPTSVLSLTKGYPNSLAFGKETSTSVSIENDKFVDKVISVGLWGAAAVDLWLNVTGSRKETVERAIASGAASVTIMRTAADTVRVALHGKMDVFFADVTHGDGQLVLIAANGTARKTELTHMGRRPTGVVRIDLKARTSMNADVRAMVEIVAAGTSMAAVNPLSASSVGILGTLFELVNCPPGKDEREASKTENPLQWHLEASNFPSSSGAVFGNLLITFGIVVFHFMIAGGIRQYRIKYADKWSWKEAFAVARFPSFSFVPVVLFYEGITEGAYVMLLYGKPWEKPVGGLIIIGFSFGILIAIFMLTSEARFHCELFPVERPYRVLNFLWGDQVWDSLRDRTFFRRWALVFKDMTFARRRFMMVDITLLHGLAATHSYRARGKQDCMIQIAVINSILVVYFGVVMFLRPFLANFDNFCTLMSALLQSLATSLVFVAVAKNDHYGDEISVSGVLLIISSAFVSAMAAVDLLTFVYERMTKTVDTAALELAMHMRKLHEDDNVEDERDTDFAQHQSFGDFSLNHRLSFFNDEVADPHTPSQTESPYTPLATRTQSVSPLCRSPINPLARSEINRRELIDWRSVPVVPTHVAQGRARALSASLNQFSPKSSTGDEPHRRVSNLGSRANSGKFVL
ncbi:hypothetical protein DIPPA_14320 [Diplonema papillatum]|nr:hypothetical protein DIPPA_14320 [Diplonema papillatum]